MRYYTKEWYDLMLRSDQTAGLRKVPDKKYTKKDIEALYEKTLRRAMAAEKKAYNTAPDLGYLLDILENEGFRAEDWMILDPQSGQPRNPSSKEEAKKFILDEQRIQTEEFNARPPFCEEEFREMFRSVYEEHLAELKQGTGSELLDSVDKRLLALELVPESVLADLKKEERAAGKEFSRINRNAERALQRQNVPYSILSGLALSDCEVLSIRKKGRDLEMVFRLDSPEGDGGSVLRRVVFKRAEILERDKGIRIRMHSHHDGCCGHDHDHDGCCDHDHDHEGCCDHDHGECVHSNCVFLISEIYNVKNAYEVHILLWMPSALKYLTVKAADIKTEDRS